MLIKQIQIEGFRNIAANTKINFNPYFNIFLGDNGSGKTSLLESIYFLTIGKSFRTNKIQHVTNFNYNFTAINAVFANRTYEQHIKISTLKPNNQVRINKIGGAIASGVEVATLTPTQLINDETSKLIFKEPELRRKFLDWIAFYINKNYQPLWRKLQTILQQRNMILKQIKHYQNEQLLEANKTLNKIDIILVELSEQITTIRQQIWVKFTHIWLQVVSDLNIVEPLITELTLFPGWHGDLKQQLLNYRNMDIKQGFTHCGPHKADLQFNINGKLSKEILSRGQGKLATCSLILARTKFIKQITATSKFVSLLLIDDLAAELDFPNISKIINALCEYKEDLQVFITGNQQQLINYKHQGLFKDLSAAYVTWFKVKQGVIAEEN